MSDKTDVYETDDILDRWIGVLPDGTEYYGADSLDELYERERDHREAMVEAAAWLAEVGAKPSREVPPPFTGIVHRVMRTTTVRTITTTETSHPREFPHV